MVAVLALLALASCEVEDDMTTEKALASLSTSNISDAEYLYVRECVTRAGEDKDVDMSGGWKVDKYGNETRIRVFDKHKKEVPVRIERIYKRTENIIHMYLRVGSDTNCVYLDILLDKVTDKIYKYPVKELGGEANYVEEYPRGMLYFASHYLYKATVGPQELTVERITPDAFDENVAYFLVSKEGVVYGASVNGGSSPYYGQGTIFMPSRRLYPVKDELVFLSGSRDLFSVVKATDDEYEVYHWQVVASNIMEKVLVGTLPGEPVEFAPMNKSNGKAVLFCRAASNPDGPASSIFEVDKQSVTVKKLALGSDVDRLNRYVETVKRPNNNGWIVRALDAKSYCLNGSASLFCFDAVNYDLTERSLNINESEYKVNHIEVDSSTGKIIFTALRYLDSANVLGEIDANGVIKIISEQASNYQITTYCALN